MFSPVESGALYLATETSACRMRAQDSPCVSCWQEVWKMRSPGERCEQ